MAKFEFFKKNKEVSAPLEEKAEVIQEGRFYSEAELAKLLEEARTEGQIHGALQGPAMALAECIIRKIAKRFSKN